MPASVRLAGLMVALLVTIALTAAVGRAYALATGAEPFAAVYTLFPPGAIEDARASGAFRSMDDPAAFGHPDHYSLRFMGLEDNGGVHRNSAIMNHVFYLAIAGGTHRLSGLSVRGVGMLNRQEIERVIVRAFTSLLPADATFAMARAATIQSARDLYGSGSRAEIAMIDAWDAVGVN